MTDEKPIGKPFCSECGKRKVAIVKGFWEETGNQMFFLECRNTECRQGCSKVGHVFKFMKSACQRCGEDCGSYGY